MTSTLEALANIRDLSKGRDRLIVLARIEGWSWSKIQEAAGLSKAGILKAAKAANGGDLPQPGEIKLKPGARIRAK